MANLKKLRRILAAGAVIALLAAIIPASPALAARDISLDRDEGKIGDNVDIDGENWPPSDPEADPPFYRQLDIYFVAYDIDDDSSADDVDDLIGYDLDDQIETYELLVSGERVDSNGDFSADFDVPDELRTGSPDADVRGGTYYVMVTYENDEDIKAVIEFTVTAGEIDDVSPDNGPVGTEVEIVGKDFAENEELTIEYDGDTINIDSDDEDTDNRGDFTLYVIIPESPAGNHTITVKDETLSEVETTFTVEPSMGFIPELSPPGDTVTVSGTGFAASDDVEITLGNVAVASGETDNDGSFTIEFTVPEVEEGTFDLVAEDGDNNDVKADFTVLVGTEVAIAPITSATAPGYVGQSVTISGVGFEPDTTIEIEFASDPTIVATTTSNADGDFSATFSIPPTQSGAHTISASDGVNPALEVPFYVESDSPPVPAPMLPLMGAQASATPTFDWESVVDDSGVTYTLQVATSSDFTSSSMILEETGLTDSEYTLTDEQSLESRSQEEPYYWRVKAVDGASNESDWTGNGEFSVGFIWPSWIVHLWWGLGVIGAIFLGYYLGKRRSYYY